MNHDSETSATSLTSAPPSPSSCEYNEKVILEHCRWLFNQNVRIITFLRPSETYPALSSVFQILDAVAIVLPASECPHSLIAANSYGMSSRGADSKILVRASHMLPLGAVELPRDKVMAKLLLTVMAKVGDMMQQNSYGMFEVKREGLPVGYHSEEVLLIL